MKFLYGTALLVLSIALCVACGPLGDNDDQGSSATPTATAGESATLAPMRVVTRTPVDPAQIPATPAGPAETIEIPTTYVVEEGDSLYSIAIRFQLDLAELVALNGLSDPNDITVGQELTLLPPQEE